MFAREHSQGATGDRTVAWERSRGARGDRTVARERSRGAMGERIVARERSRGATFRATVHITTSVTGPIIINVYQKPKVNIFSYVMVVINKNASDDRKRVYVRDSIEAKKCHAVG